MRKLWFLPCMVLALAAAESGVSGKWAGTIDVVDSTSGTTINTPVRMELVEKDGSISGKIGRREDMDVEPIRNGRIDGSKVFFEVNSTETSAKVKFALTLSGKTMEGEMKGSMDSAPISGKVHLTRQGGD